MIEYKNRARVFGGISVRQERAEPHYSLQISSNNGLQKYAQELRCVGSE
jgi:hypothetical protein